MPFQLFVLKEMPIICILYSIKHNLIIILLINLFMSNPQEYINNPLNSSVSKFAYSFSRSKRFPRQKIKTQTTVNLPSTFSKRSTSFGYGTKIDIANRSFSPPPGAYQLASEFKKDNKNSISFGLGRDQISFGGFLERANKLKTQPSPNAYNAKIKVYSSIGGRMGQKLPSDLDLLTKKQTPGPGAYNFQGVNLNHSGSYVLSTVKNSISPRYFNQTGFSPKKSNRQTSPGPGFYNTIQKQIGKYTSSKYKNIYIRTFNKSLRSGPQDRTKLKFPGYKYKRFSQFGYNN